MKQYYGLLYSIAQEYNILRGSHESESSWKARIIYSMLGQTGYASLWDVQEDLQLSSIIHFKGRIEDVLNSLVRMYPELSTTFSRNLDNLSTEIYNVLANTGCIYHEPNRISAPMRKASAGSNCVFLRGQAICEKRWVSGIGCYLPFKNGENTTTTISEMFQLQEIPLSSAWKQIVSEVKWEKSPDGIQMQYMRLAPPFKYGYWVDSPDSTGGVSISRTGFSGSHLYYLYKTEGGTQLVSQLPNWMVEGGNYRAVSVVCLAARGTLPPTKYHIDGEIVYISIAYLFPPSELNIIRLYSWPTSYIELPHDFSRAMSLSVFENIQEEFEKIGYQFEEE